MSPAALTEMDPLSGPPSEIFDATLSVAGSMPHRAPGTATGTQTAPAPTATPAGPAPAAPTGNGGHHAVGGRVDAGDLLIAGHPEASGAGDHARGHPAGPDGGHHRRRPHRARRTPARRRLPARWTRWRSRVGRRPPGPSPPPRPPEASARITASQRRLDTIRRRPRRGRRPPGGRPGVGGRVAVPIARQPMAPPGPPGITRNGGAVTPGETRRPAARAGQPHPTRAARPSPSRAVLARARPRFAPRAPAAPRAGRRRAGSRRCRAWAGAAPGKAPEGPLVAIRRASSPAHVRRRHGPVRPLAPRCGAPGTPPARRRP